MSSDKKQTGRKRLKGRIFVLAILITLQGLLSLGLTRFEPNIEKGFLIKDGSEYRVIWKENDRYWEKKFGSLRTAMGFAGESLTLTHRENRLRAAELERVWVQDRFGRYLLMWKTHALPYLHQWTFDSREEVDFFLSAFRAGGYSPSPFGHALVLRPVRTN